MFSVMENTFDVNAFEKVQITREIVEEIKGICCVALIFLFIPFNIPLMLLTLKLEINLF